MNLYQNWMNENDERLEITRSVIVPAFFAHPEICEHDRQIFRDFCEDPQSVWEAEFISGIDLSRFMEAYLKIIAEGMRVEWVCEKEIANEEDFDCLNETIRRFNRVILDDNLAKGSLLTLI